MEIKSEELISHILSRPPLWDSTHIHHKNRRIMNKCWGELKLIFNNVEISVLKKRWKNLKDQYRKELKKVTASISAGSGVSNPSSWQYFDQMNFLKLDILPDDSSANVQPNVTENDTDIQISNTTSSPVSLLNSEINSPESIESDNISVNSRSSVDTVNTLQSSLDDDEIRLTNEAPTSTPMTNKSTSKSRPLKRKSANDIRIEMLKLEKKRLLLLEKELERSSNVTQSAANKSEDYYYLMSLLPQMESFSPLHKYNVRNKINKIMMEEIQNSMFADPHKGTASPIYFPKSPKTE